jgi:hypothetical protein
MRSNQPNNKCRPAHSENVERAALGAAARNGILRHKPANVKYQAKHRNSNTKAKSADYAMLLALANFWIITVITLRVY